MDELHKRNVGRDYIRLSHNRAWIEGKRQTSGIPTSAMFSDGNGGEYRKSAHVLAPPFAQIVKSPATLAGSPMQIDTWNRDEMNLTGHVKFVPGPYPKTSLAPRSGPDAIYSGLLECPLTTRIKKHFQNNNSDFENTYDLQYFDCTLVVRSYTVSRMHTRTPPTQVRLLVDPVSTNCPLRRNVSNMPRTFSPRSLSS